MGRIELLRMGLKSLEGVGVSGVPFLVEALELQINLIRNKNF